MFTSPLQPSPLPELIVRYRRSRGWSGVEEIHHPLVREALRLPGQRRPRLEITSMADIPAGTGLGSSGSFTTALLKVCTRARENLYPSAGVGRAGLPHRDRLLEEPIGKQDQYIAATVG